LIQITPQMRILVAVEPVDFRRGIDGLDYDRHTRSGEGAATKNHYLVLGPWDHAGTRNPSIELDGMKFAKESALNMKALHLAWYDWQLKNGQKPAFLADRVMAWSMGAEKWIASEPVA
jgi:hypothetical protein